MLLAALFLASLSPPRDRDDDDDRERAKPARVHGPKPATPTATSARTRDDDDDDDQPKAVPTPSVTLPMQRPAVAPSRRPDDDDSAMSGASAAAPSKPQRDDEHDDEEDEGGAQPTTEVVVTARRLDAARTLIDVGLGATVTTLSNDAVENRPGGETGSISSILQQVPGVGLSGRSLTIRGGPANQVRINNVIVPEAIADPADLLSSRLAETTRLITGTLPAQFGFAPAGVISITTKNGLYQHGGQAELFAGSDGMVEPALEWAGSAGRTSLFASGSLERNRVKVVDATGAETRDRAVLLEGLGFADHVIDSDNRVSLILGGSHERHRFGPTSVGPGEEKAGSGYGVVALQHSDGGFTIQASLFFGASGDKAAFLRTSEERRSSWGSQIDGSANVGTEHLVRFGLLATRSTVRQTGRSETGRIARTTLGLYAQDEWSLGGGVTLNPGVRVEWLEGLQHRAAVEPRASLVWAPTTGLTAHVGYARYAAAPPLDELAALPPLGRETDNLIDAGLSRTWGRLTVTADAYWRGARGLLVARRVVGSALPESFEFRRGRLRGIELSASYARRGTTAWSSLSLSRADGSGIIGGAIFPATTLAAKGGGTVPLGTNRPVRLAGGFTQRFGHFSLGADTLLSSGAVRTLTPTQPNGSRRPFHAEVGLAGVYHLTVAGKPVDLRLDLTNLTDSHAPSNDATALEGDWTRLARRRAITVGIEQGF